MHELKTGRLIAASIGAVALVEGASQAVREDLTRFAVELGVLFQIIDDILDVTGSREQLGKPSGADERLGKRTYVSVFGLERARELAAASHRGAREALAEVAPRLAGDVSDLESITDFIHTRKE
jgi:geranylgeranyl diphosphate synthase type II